MSLTPEQIEQQVAEYREQLEREARGEMHPTVDKFIRRNRERANGPNALRPARNPAGSR